MIKTMMGHREKLKGGFEWDWTSRWRRRGWIKFNPGVGRYVKRCMAKRTRQSAKKDLKGLKHNDGKLHTRWA